MSTEFIFGDAKFGPIQSMDLGKETLKKFMSDHIDPHPTYSRLLSNLSNLVVLVASIGSDGIVEDGEAKWEDIMGEEQYQFLKENRELIVGYMSMEEDDDKKNLTYIKMCDTALRGNDILKYMIDRYKKEKKIPDVLPYIIPSFAAGYWKKYFNQVYGIESEIQLENWDMVRDGWECLFQNWDNINGRYDTKTTGHTLGKSQDFLKEL